MKRIQIFFFLISCTIGFGQKKGVDKLTGGLTAYYFWEEDSLGFIKNSSIDQPYLQNYTIRFDTESGKIINGKLRARLLKNTISSFTHEIGGSRKRRINDSTNNLRVPLKRIQAEYPTSMLITKNNSEWSSRIRKNVIYFTIDAEKKMRYSHASDSLVLSSFHFRQFTEGHFIVYSFLNASGGIEKQEIYNYNGEMQNEAQLNSIATPPVRYLVFSNGYRGRKKNKDKTDNLITNFDRYGYWYKLDDSIIERLHPISTFYIDGSMGVKTSSHRSKLGFGISYVKASIFRKSTKAKRILNTRENPVGFETRKQEGRIAGRSFLITRCSSPNCERVKDTIDLVCHSMGYAYAIGFMEEIKDRVVFRKIYILAPESGCVDGFDWQKCQEVWQYGAHDDHVPVSELDMVAPQCMVKGLDTIPVERGGRVYIPSEQIEEFQNKEKYSIIDIHDTKYFDWIINQITLGSPGYIIN